MSDRTSYEPLVAIVTRTKDRPLLLDRAIRSVLAQTFERWEHVIVNDGGDDAVVDELVERHRLAYAGRVRVVHRVISGGMESASNAGIRASESRFVALLDDDDTWEPEFLASTTSFLLGPKPTSVRGVATRSTTIHERLTDDGADELSREATNPTLKQVTLFRTAAANVFTNNAFVFERSAYDDVGGYREDLPVLGDWEFNLRFLGKFDIAVLPQALANYHQRERGGPAGYANTVVDGVNTHLLVESVLRNEWMRADLARGASGLGVASGVGAMLVDLERRVLFTIERTAADPMSVARRAMRWGRTRAERAIEGLGTRGRDEKR